MKLKIIFLYIAVFLISSCSKDIAEYGKVTPYGANDNKSFVFSVTKEYAAKNKGSRKDIDHPKMSLAEADLLRGLMRRNKMCLNDYTNPDFIITSKQERIYDVTFASLIRENYNAKPVTPLRYYGRCRGSTELFTQ